MSLYICSLTYMIKVMYPRCIQNTHERENCTYSILHNTCNIGNEIFTNFTNFHKFILPRNNACGLIMQFFNWKKNTFDEKRGRAT